METRGQSACVTSWTWSRRAARETWERERERERSSFLSFYYWIYQQKFSYICPAFYVFPLLALVILHISSSFQCRNCKSKITDVRSAFAKGTFMSFFFWFYSLWSFCSTEDIQWRLKTIKEVELMCWFSIRNTFTCIGLFYPHKDVFSLFFCSGPQICCYSASNPGIPPLHPFILSPFWPPLSSEPIESKTLEAVCCFCASNIAQNGMFFSLLFHFCDLLFCTNVFVFVFCRRLLKQHSAAP